MCYHGPLLGERNGAPDEVHGSTIDPKRGIRTLRGDKCLQTRDKHIHKGDLTEQPHIHEGVNGVISKGQQWEHV